MIRLVRKTQLAPGEIRWDPYAQTLDIEALEGLDAVVHLAGENIADGRWTAGKKLRIRESRIQGTRFLAQSLASLFDPPKVLVSVSAIGYYGDRGDELLDEESDSRERVFGGCMPRMGSRNSAGSYARDSCGSSATGDGAQPCRAERWHACFRLSVWESAAGSAADGNT